MHRFTLLLFSLIIFNANAQNGRFIQQVDLTAEENAPFFSRDYSLPELTIEAIRAGEIHAYDVDYSKNTLTTLTPEQFSSRLIISIEDFGFGSSDTILYAGNDFNTIEIDLSKKNNEITAIHYIHFKVKDSATPGQPRFSVSFTELSDYLIQKKALWIRNSSSWFWKGQVAHLNGYYASDIIYNTFPDANYSYIHLYKGADGSYEKLQVYSMDHTLAQELPLRSSSIKAEIKLMASALQNGDYLAFGEEKLRTKIRETSKLVTPHALDENFMIIQNEEIHLLHPENTKFYMEDKELPTLIIEAIEEGKITKIFKDNLLTAPMTKEEWLHNASEEVMYSEDDWESEDDFESRRVMYSGRSATIVAVSWKKYFNLQGEVLAQMPHSIGLFIGPEQTLTGLSKPLGYFSFNDVYHVLKNSPDAYYNSPESGNFINDLMKRDYFSYFTSTSGIMVQSR
ncbi:hypothetical protein LVD17_27880 [Fulvivirga ulvae]|uniref:hypothetical protein n=1 Tax=Fulvivirga ulvae TaxID=2904245 RepID=UPI001F33FF9E|nr:hypothetical protein [Fulvivirga ulvae]UII32108.1 hypothetical protein LVD17_27880 [Fulvivirga ulvae]